MKVQHITQQRWAIVLAGGYGTRLQGLTRKTDGAAREKQFSRIFGDWSPRGTTREHLKQMTSMAEGARVVMRNTATV